MLVRQILSGLCCLACLPAHSMDLLQAWELLQLQGPTYRAAVHERAAGLENPAIGRAGLLPQITARASKSQVDGTQEQQNALGRRIENDLDYDSENLSLQLRQPLYNRQKMVE